MDLNFSDKWVRGVIGVAIAIVTLSILLSTYINLEATRKRESNKGFGAPALPQHFVYANPSHPVRLVIPKIKVDAAVESVGVTNDDAMDTPKGPEDVAWFNLGPIPGGVGSAVISGHYGWSGGRAAAFDTLSALRKGDMLFVVDSSAATTTFTVREEKTLGEYADASSVFYSSDGKAHLNLITCEGVWDSSRRSYSNRLIIFADKI